MGGGGREGTGGRERECVCVYEFVCAMCMPETMEVRRGHWVYFNWNYRQLS